ncbi:LamG-like jellyroll fold domain-containing protein [Portibacter lacus]|nr:LamG-like jellyroll fold domain-containing protein [Portibacter lacus]
MSVILRHLASWDSYAINLKTGSLFLFLFMCVALNAQAPNWAELMYKEGADVQKVSEAYEAYYESHEFVKNRYTQDYKRFLRGKTREAFELKDTKTLRSQQELYQNKLLINNTRGPGSTWQPLGPFDIDLNSSAVGTTPGLAHIYTVEKNGFLVAGTATSGAWKSTNNGSTWQAITKNLMVTEVKAVEIVGSTIYIGGNGHIYKSTNGGSSWSETGSSSFKNQYHNTLDIVSSNSVLFAATNYGFYRSTDAGNNWTQIASGKVQEIEVHPTNPDVIYFIKQEGSGTAFYRSMDGGLNFTQLTNGYPVVANGEEQLRTEIAVTQAQPDRIVALATGIANGGSGLYGIYVSDDMGSSWTFKCCGTGPGGPASASNKNIMAWQITGEVSGGQYYYDVALAVSQINPDEIYTGGINIWKSTDGGTTFVNNADYIFNKAKEKYVHADIQDIRIIGNEIWVATDGGIFMSNDSAETFNKRMYGIVGTDFRGFGAGAKDGEVLIGGTYHNGTLLKENNTYEGGWLSTYSGDNTHGNVNPQNNKITYSDIGIMTLPGNASSVPTLKTLTIKPNASYKTGESSEYVFHPNSGDIFFLGSGGSLFKTTDNGTNFTQLHNFGSGKVTKIEIAPANPDIIYVVYYPSYDSHKKLYRTTDGGQSWDDISPLSSVFQNNKLWIAWDIAVSSTNPDELWLARTPQTSSNANIDGYQVFHTADAGGSWNNISTSSLNGEMLTNIVHQHGTNGGVYIGTRRTVFYKNAAMSQWALFQNGLPALTYSTNLVILYNQNKIVNATHRGVYSVDLYETVVKDVAFQVDKTEGLCERDFFQFSNNSKGFLASATVKWTFENGNPSVSYDENPMVRFNGVGGHNVTLEIIENGKSTQKTEVDFITVQESCGIESLPGSALRTNNNNYLIVPAIGLETNEISFSTWVKREGTTKDNAGLFTMRRFANTTGLSISSSGEVKYMWDQVELGIPTGLKIEKSKWTHVAMTVSPTELRVYVDGIEKVFAGNYSPVIFDKDLLIGKDINSYIYYFNGYFDEFSVYDKTLSTAEVRSHMNLVKYEEAVSGLHNYFQFNDETSVTKDVIGSKHASFFSNADFVESMAPIGKGTSQVKKIENFGIHTFDAVNVELNIESGISCNSDLGVYRIERNVSGSSDLHSSDYLYIVNHFAEDDFIINGEISISRAFDELVDSGVSKDSFKLYQLAFDEVPEWENNTRAYSMDFDPDNDDKVIFEVHEEKEMEGKFLVSYNPMNASLAISDIYFELDIIRPGVVDVQWFLHPEDHFIRTELQRSGDGRRFEAIKVIDNEEGQLAFSYIDESPLKGRNYYRVKMTYDDLSTDYSKIDHIRVSSTIADQFLYPNPLVGGSELVLNDVRLDGASMTIYNMTGKKVKYLSNIERGKVDVSSLSAGSYIVVIDERTARRQQILIKN